MELCVCVKLLIRLLCILFKAFKQFCSEKKTKIIINKCNNSEQNPFFMCIHCIESIVYTTQLLQ